MPAIDITRPLATEPEGLGDVLERLTTAHAEMEERHGPLFGMKGVDPPAGAARFAAEQERLAARQDAEADPTRRLDLMLERNAREHEQIGRLASFIAGYELAHGDPGNAPAMMELGGDHFDLAAQTRETLNERAALAERSRPQAMGDLIPADIMAELRAKSSNDRGSPGRDL